ncbi:hypothetical protein [Saccharicrinis aurantiacus]|uniref:hypothetical protein n=1 Tax=Saccharicrinis aurantiacus TaxID=1849719 RepID=UPI000839ADE0|nr:hypothetical protein [Saccharicrinis aurantiacus]
MRNLVLLISILTISSCNIENKKKVDEIVKSTLDVKQISKGNSKPKIDITNDEMDVFLVALHYNIPVSEIANTLKWDEEKTKYNISILIENGLLQKQDDKLVPGLGIFTLERGRLLTEKCSLLAKEIADSIKGKIPDLVKLHDNSDISKVYSFYDLSFFYLSDVLLDVGQINNVEKRFLRKERPLRNGSRYYLAILEKENESIEEAYGIYGNQVIVRNDSTLISVYGNTRTDQHKGWKNYKEKVVHSFSKNDFNTVVYEMPKVFLPTLVQILEKHKLDFEKVYKELAFDKEITFEEFFIWWYHIIYTETTDVLMEQNVIKRPQDGLFYYKMSM